MKNPELSLSGRAPDFYVKSDFHMKAVSAGQDRVLGRISRSSELHVPGSGENVVSGNVSIGNFVSEELSHDFEALGLTRLDIREVGPGDSDHMDTLRTWQITFWSKGRYSSGMEDVPRSNSSSIRL